MLEIKILGIPESKEVEELMERVRIAKERLELECDIQVEGDLLKLIEFNLSGIPALVIEGTVVFEKEIPVLDDILLSLQAYENNSPSE